MLPEKTWLGDSVRNSNDSGELAVIVVVQTWLTRPGGSGNREASKTSRQQLWRQNKLGLAATTELRRGESEMVVTATVATQIWICGRGCSKMVETAVTTRWQIELGFALASATAMAATRNQQQ